MNPYLFVMWFLQLQYLVLLALALTGGNWAKVVYWLGVIIINFGVMYLK